jgi:hypothetical protein
MIINTSVFNDVKIPFRYDNILTSIEGNVLVGYMQSYIIANVHTSESERFPRSELIEFYGEETVLLMDEINAEDNPIILFFKIKNF